MKINYQACSNVGRVRSNNEDMILVDRQFLRDECTQGTGEINRNSRFSAIVADGMGGNDGGELASDIATQEFDTWVHDLPSDLDADALKKRVDSFVQFAHSLINRRGMQLDGFHGMGTTLVGIFFYEGTSYTINIGDSRIYIYRDGILRQVTKDHSMRNLLHDPSQPSNLIYNCLGSGYDNEAFADLDAFPVFEGDRLLICSDGLSDMVDDEELSRLFGLGADAKQFVDLALDSGGHDNVSVILMDII